jgi:hypothetical protein
MQFVKNLEIEIQLFQNNAVLHTQRLQVQPATIFFGNLAGSIIGILGVVGFAMNQFEKNYEHIMRKVDNKMIKSQIYDNHIQIISKNFDILNRVVFPSKERSTNSIDFINDMSEDHKIYTGKTTRREDPLRLRVEALSPP